MILIVGGTGMLGSAVAKRLLAGGEAVRIMTRTPAKAASLLRAGAEVVSGDLLDRESMVRACAGVGSVVAAAHSFMGRGRLASAHVDDAGHRRLIDISVTAGIHRFVYLSAYQPDPAYTQVPFFRIKREVEQHLKASHLHYTILRPTAFMDFHAHVLIGKPVLERGKVTLIGRGDRARNFVAADDVAQLVVLALRDAWLTGETIDIGGPENLTNIDVVRLYERISGRPAKVRHLPLSVARALSRVVSSVHEGLSQVMQVAVLGDSTDQRFDARAFGQRFPIELTRLEHWVGRHSGWAALR